MGNIRPFLPLLIAAGLLLGGNGLSSTLVAIKGSEAGMSTAQIGWMGTTYFIGFIAACMLVPHAIRIVGYVRTFAMLASLAAVATMIMILYINPINWMIQRLIIGACFSGLFTTIESWLNSGVQNNTRGKILAVYRIIDIVCVSGSQYMMPIVGTDGFELFVIMALLITISLVPVTLADRSNPKPPEEFHFNIKEIWRISPIACTGCFIIGMTNATFRFIGPLYAENIGLGITEIATFISLGVIGGASLQYPLGYLSDRYDRRWVLITTTIGAMLAGIMLAYGYQYEKTFIYIAIFMFGAFSLPLFSLSTAHANDRAQKNQYVLIAAGVMFFYGVGAAMGPPIASAMLEVFGPISLFTFTSSCHGILVVATLWRMIIRDAVPQKHRVKFTMLVRTSPFMQKLTRNKMKIKYENNK